MTNAELDQIIETQLPIAWEAGVRIKSISDTEAVTYVPLTRMSQNPFKSMFWAVQGMAAEFSTGFMCMDKITETQQPISMLVVEQSAKFIKKAVGIIEFKCNQGSEIDSIIQKAIDTKKGQMIVLESIGIDEAGDIVSKFKFTWSFKLKS